MPRVGRALADEQIYHIINRGNRRDRIFHDEYDFTKMISSFPSFTWKCTRASIDPEVMVLILKFWHKLIK